jgi:hypothetical protein
MLGQPQWWQNLTLVPLAAVAVVLLVVVARRRHVADKANAKIVAFAATASLFSDLAIVALYSLTALRPSNTWIRDPMPMFQIVAGIVIGLIFIVGAILLLALPRSGVRNRQRLHRNPTLSVRQAPPKLPPRTAATPIDGRSMQDTERLPVLVSEAERKTTSLEVAIAIGGATLATMTVIWAIVRAFTHSDSSPKPEG